MCPVGEQKKVSKLTTGIHDHVQLLTWLHIAASVVLGIRRFLLTLCFSFNTRFHQNLNKNIKIGCTLQLLLYLSSGNPLVWVLMRNTESSLILMYGIDVLETDCFVP